MKFLVWIINPLCTLFGPKMGEAEGAVAANFNEFVLVNVCEGSQCT